MIEINGRTIQWEEDITVKRALEKMNYTFPMIIVKVDGKTVSREEWDRFIIHRGAKVQALHQIAGG